jgi:hypothetical protein
MGEKHSLQKRVVIEPSGLDPNSFKEIEQFSKQVCQGLAVKHGDQFKQTQVVYGLTAFLSAVHQAVNRHTSKKLL